MERLAPDAHGALERATAILDAGELLVLALDGGYALAGDALHDEVVERIFLATGRSADDALPVVIGGFEDIQHIAFATPLARALSDRFWPGPLTMLMRARPWVPDAVSAGGETVGVRVPDADFARQLARHFGPIAVADVADPIRIGAAAHLLVDSGPRAPRPQTLVDATGQEAKVLREGAIGAAEVAAIGR